MATFEKKVSGIELGDGLRISGKDGVITYEATTHTFIGDVGLALNDLTIDDLTADTITTTGTVKLTAGQKLGLNASATDFIQDDGSGNQNVGVATGKTWLLTTNGSRTATIFDAGQGAGHGGIWFGNATPAETNAALRKLADGTFRLAGDTIAIAATGKMTHPTGAAGTSGTATLVSGTVTVETTAVLTGSLIFLSLNTPGGTQGTHYSAPVASITNATSFVINAVDTSGSVVNTDVSTVNWWVIN